MVTRLAAFTLCCAFVVAAAIPHADAQSDSAGVDASGGTAAPDARVALLFTPAASEHRALEDRWRQLRQAPAGTPDEEQAFLAFERTALELGYVDLPAHGLALLLEAETARRTGDVGRASILRHRAAQIAPTSPQPAFFRARLAADEGPASVVAMSRHLTRAYQRLGQTVAGHLALQTFARELLGLVFLVFAALFGLLLAGRALGPAALDLRLLSAKTLTLGHGRMLVVLVLVAPAAMLWSPLLALLGPFVVAAPYAKLGERAMSLMVLAGIAALPWVAADMANRLAAPSADTETALSAMVGPCDTTCEADLSAAAEGGDSVAQLARAWVAYRRGTASGVTSASSLVSGTEWPVPLQSSVALLQGNIAFNHERVDDAERAYLSAFEAARTPTQRAAALFNLYQLGLHVGAREAAQSSLDQAMQLDAPLVDRYLRHQARSQNLMLAIAGVPASALTEAVALPQATGLAERASTERLSRAYGRLPAGLAPLATGAVAAWMLLWGLLRPLGWTSSRCARCGSGSSRFLAAEAFLKGRCAPCMELQHGAGRLSIGERKWREGRIERWERWTGTLGLVSLLALPGAHAIAAGQTLRGAFVLALSALTAGLVLVDPTPLSVPYALGSGTQFDGRVPLAIALYAVSVLFAVGLYLVHRRRR